MLNEFQRIHSEIRVIFVQVFGVARSMIKKKTGEKIDKTISSEKEIECTKIPILINCNF